MNNEHPAGDMDYYQFDATANVIKTDHTPALRFRANHSAFSCRALNAHTKQKHPKATIPNAITVSKYGPNG